VYFIIIWSWFVYFTFATPFSIRLFFPALMRSLAGIFPLLCFSSTQFFADQTPTSPSDRKAYLSVAMNKSKEEFVSFIRIAVNQKSSLAYQELYQYLLKCFIRADLDMTGKVS